MDQSKHWNDSMKNVIFDNIFVIFHWIINVWMPMFAVIHNLYIVIENTVCVCMFKRMIL